MSKQIRVRSVRKPEVDTDQLAVAFLLLAKILHEREQATPPGPGGEDPADARPDQVRRST